MWCSSTLPRYSAAAAMARRSPARDSFGRVSKLFYLFYADSRISLPKPSRVDNFVLLRTLQAMKSSVSSIQEQAILCRNAIVNFSYPHSQLLVLNGVRTAGEMPFLVKP